MITPPFSAEFYQLVVKKCGIGITAKTVSNHLNGNRQAEMYSQATKDAINKAFYAAWTEWIIAQDEKVKLFKEEKFVELERMASAA